MLFDLCFLGRLGLVFFMRTPPSMWHRMFWNIQTFKQLKTSKTSNTTSLPSLLKRKSILKIRKRKNRGRHQPPLQTRTGESATLQRIVKSSTLQGRKHHHLHLGAGAALSLPSLGGAGSPPSFGSWCSPPVVKFPLLFLPGGPSLGGGTFQLGASSLSFFGVLQRVSCSSVN